MYKSKISLVKENKSTLKDEYKVGETLTRVKVVGIGNKALKVLVFEASKFCSEPVWKQYWINFERDVPESKMAQLLIEEMVKSIPQQTL